MGINISKILNIQTNISKFLQVVATKQFLNHIALEINDAIVSMYELIY